MFLKKWPSYAVLNGGADGTGKTRADEKRKWARGEKRPFAEFMHPRHSPVSLSLSAPIEFFIFFNRSSKKQVNAKMGNVQ